MIATLLPNVPASEQAEWQREQRLWALAHDLCNRLGIRPKSEDLEDFVADNASLGCDL